MSGTEKPSIDELMREVQAAQPEPPEDLRAGVMRRVRDVEGRLTWFQRWRRSSRATNFSSRPGVDSSNFSPLGGLIPGRVQAMKKVLVAASALGAGALVLAYWFGFPPTGQGTEGTVGAANRYQATVKLGDKDVVVGDMAVQKFMQSATFDRVMKNKNARVVLRKIAKSPELRKAFANPAFVEFMKAPETLELLSDMEFKYLIAQPALMQLMARPEFRDNFAEMEHRHKMLAEADFAGLASNAAFIELAQNPSFAELIADASFAKIAADASFQQLFASPIFAELISMAEYKISFADADFDAAMMSLEMHNLLATPSFEAALIQMD